MSDISNQLIKDSYNYVLQSDFSTGIVYRIGGGIPVNPTFLSGLTINSGFTYSNGTEQPGYALITDAFGNANWGPVSGSSSGNYLSLSGGTVTGPTIFTGGLTANTISATTYFNLPVSGVTGGTGISANTSNGFVTIVNTAPDQIVTLSGGTGISTGGTYPNFVLTNTAPDQVVTITGGTNIGINGAYPNFGINFTGSTGASGDFLPLSGGTVTGATNFTGGLTANTISATTYLNLPLPDERRNANNSTNNNINYCGTAPNGSSESSSVWTITRLTISSDGSVTTAVATNVKWDDRETAIYI